MQNKKAAFEMSMTTLVVIVIAVIMLILGMAFVRQIFGTATKSVSIVDQQVKSKLQTMFGEESRNIVLYSKSIDIKPGTESFTVPFAAMKPGGGPVSELKYKVTLVGGNCETLNPGQVNSWFISPQLNTPITFNSYEVNIAYADVIISVPKSAVYCKEIVKIELIDQTVADTFTLNVVKGGPF